MAKQLKLFPSNSMADTPVEVPVFHEVAGDITAAVPIDILAPFDFRFTEIGQLFLQVGTTGADGTDPLSVSLEVAINGTTVFATKPDVTDDAADGAKTLADGTGITVGALSATAAELEGSKGDVITITIQVTRTTPETEAADARACVILREISDFEPLVTTARTS